VRFLVAVTVATGAAALASQVALEWPRSSGSTVVGACVAGAVFAAVTAMAGTTRVRVAVAVAWSLPLLAAAGAWGAVWSRLRVGGAVVFAGVMGAALVGVVWWGSPMWGSRLACRARGAPRAVPLLTAAVALLAVATALMARVTSDVDATHTWTWASAGIAEVVLAMTASGVRQWRLAPTPRAVGFAVTTGTAVGVIVAASAFANDRSWVWISIVVMAMFVALLVARQPARVVRRTAGATRASQGVPRP
jgi:hypothetical protein